MALVAAGIAGAAILEGAGILKAGTDVAIGGTGNYIKNGTPIGIVPTLGLAIARETCRAYSSNPAAVDSDAAVNYEKACRPYLDDIGSGSGPTLKKPFSGGQCPVSYNVQVIDSLGPTIDFNQTLLGPIGPFTVELTGPPNYLMIIRVPFAGGVAQGVVGARGPDVLARQSQIVTRIDGQPDNCGSPPPVLKQPDPTPSPRPRITPIVIAPNINVDVDIQINNIGAVVIDLGLGPVTIDPFADDDGGGGGGGGGGGRPPGDVGTPGLPSGTGDGGDTEGEAPAGKVLTGLRVNYTAAPPKFAEVAPAVFRAPCYIYMGTSSGLDMDFAGSLVKDNQFIFAEKDNLTKWKVVANRGFSLTVTPFYADPV